MREAKMNLTLAEIHWLRRRRAGVRQPQWAKARGISIDRLQAQESGREDAPPVPPLPSLTEGEWCALQRRRRGWTMARASEESGMSRMTVWKAEHDRTAGVAALRRFYVAAGVLQAPASASGGTLTAVQEAGA